MTVHSLVSLTPEQVREFKELLDRFMSIEGFEAEKAQFWYKVGVADKESPYRSSKYSRLYAANEIRKFRESGTMKAEDLSKLPKMEADILLMAAENSRHVQLKLTAAEAAVLLSEIKGYESDAFRLLDTNFNNNLKRILKKYPSANALTEITNDQDRKLKAFKMFIDSRIKDTAASSLKDSYKERYDNVAERYKQLWWVLVSRPAQATLQCFLSLRGRGYYGIKEQG